MWFEIEKTRPVTDGNDMSSLWWKISIVNNLLCARKVERDESKPMGTMTVKVLLSVKYTKGFQR